MIIFPLLNHAEVSVMAGCFIGKRKDYKKNSSKLNLRQKKKIYPSSADRMRARQKQFFPFVRENY